MDGNYKNREGNSKAMHLFRQNWQVCYLTNLGAMVDIHPGKKASTDPNKTDDGIKRLS